MRTAYAHGYLIDWLLTWCSHVQVWMVTESLIGPSGTDGGGGGNITSTFLTRIMSDIRHLDG